MIFYILKLTIQAIILIKICMYLIILVKELSYAQSDKLFAIRFQINKKQLPWVPRPQIHQIPPYFPCLLGLHSQLSDINQYIED